MTKKRWQTWTEEGETFMVHTTIKEDDAGIRLITHIFIMKDNTG